MDEAGFFLKDSDRGFTGEALKEFVRYMENYPDVTVIFAMYEHEMQDFLALDEGLSSRIARKVQFADYSTEELMEICQSMLREKGYGIDEMAREYVRGYLAGRDEDFGNARGVRKLVEGLVTAHSMDYAEHMKNLGRMPEKLQKDWLPQIGYAQAYEGINRMLRNGKQTVRRQIGFRLEG